jgi:hypothetical protein
MCTRLLLQLETVMSRLRSIASAKTPLPLSNLPLLVNTLEVLARMCWHSLDGKEAVAAVSASYVLVAVMRLHAVDAADSSTCGYTAVQAAACMALASLAYGTGDVCLTNQWDIGKVGVCARVGCAHVREHAVHVLHSTFCFFCSTEHIQLYAGNMQAPIMSNTHPNPTLRCCFVHRTNC